MIRIKMINLNGEISIMADEDGRKIVVINDVGFKGKKITEWYEIEKYLYD